METKETTRKKWNWYRLSNYSISYKELIKNNKLLLKTQQKFKSERHNVFTEKIIEIALSWNDEERMRSIDSIKTCNEKGTSKDLVCKKEEIKYNNIIKQYKKWSTLMMLHKKR